MHACHQSRIRCMQRITSEKVVNCTYCTGIFRTCEELSRTQGATAKSPCLSGVVEPSISREGGKVIAYLYAVLLPPSNQKNFTVSSMDSQEERFGTRHQLEVLQERAAQREVLRRIGQRVPLDFVSAWPSDVDWQTEVLSHPFKNVGDFCVLTEVMVRREWPVDENFPELERIRDGDILLALEGSIGTEERVLSDDGRTVSRCWYNLSQAARAMQGRTAFEVEGTNREVKCVYSEWCVQSIREFNRMWNVHEVGQRIEGARRCMYLAAVREDTVGGEVKWTGRYRYVEDALFTMLHLPIPEGGKHKIPPGGQKRKSRGDRSSPVKRRRQSAGRGGGRAGRESVQRQQAEEVLPHTPMGSPYAGVLTRPSSTGAPSRDPARELELAGAPGLVAAWRQAGAAQHMRPVSKLR